MAKVMDFEVPDWLNEICIKNALEHGKEYEITVEDMMLDMPIAKGNNYVCDIFRAQVKYRKSKDFDKIRSTSLIIKCPKKGEMYEKMMTFDLLQKEPSMYYKFSPRLLSIFANNNQNGEIIDDDFFAKSYFTTKENVLILKDLKLDGYKMADRLKQLDYDHCLIAIKALAKFHAGSVIIHENEPDLIEKLGEDFLLLESSENMFKEFITNSIKILAGAIKMYSQTEKYSNWFDKNAEYFWEKIKDSVKRDENEFNVLNHGDFWSSNMLFKYNDNNVPVKIKPIDLQLCRYSSPVLDVMYFMESSAQINVKKENYNDLLNIYLNELNKNLEKFGSSKRLEKSEFEKSWEKRSFFRLYSATIIMPFVVANPESTELLDFKNTTSDSFSNIENNPMISYYKNEYFIELISKSLEDFEKIGLIKVI